MKGRSRRGKSNYKRQKENNHERTERKRAKEEQRREMERKKGSSGRELQWRRHGKGGKCEDKEVTKEEGEKPRSNIKVDKQLEAKGEEEWYWKEGGTGRKGEEGRENRYQKGGRGRKSQVTRREWKMEEREK